MRLFVYDMLVNVNVIYYVHVCKQARWACSAGNSAIENYVLLLLLYSVWDFCKSKIIKTVLLFVYHDGLFLLAIENYGKEGGQLKHSKTMLSIL